MSIDKRVEHLLSPLPAVLASNFYVQDKTKALLEAAGEGNEERVDDCVFSVLAEVVKFTLVNHEAVTNG